MSRSKATSNNNQKTKVKKDTIKLEHPLTIIGTEDEYKPYDGPIVPRVHHVYGGVQKEPIIERNDENFLYHEMDFCSFKKNPKNKYNTYTIPNNKKEKKSYTDKSLNERKEKLKIVAAANLNNNITKPINNANPKKNTSNLNNHDENDKNKEKSLRERREKLRIAAGAIETSNKNKNNEKKDKYKK